MGDRFVGKRLPDEAARKGIDMPPYSVVTMHLVDKKGEPTKYAVDEILDFYRQILL